MASQPAPWPGPPRPLASPKETARYISSMAIGLRGLAGAARFDFLAHLLDMVAEEADHAARSNRSEPDAHRTGKLAAGR